MKKLIFVAVIALISVFGYLKAEQGDFATLGYNTPSGYSYWRVNSSGHFIPGYTNTYNIGSSAAKIATVYATTFDGAMSGTFSGTTGAFTGAVTSVGSSGIQVSTTSTSLYSLSLMGAVVTLSTMPARAGLIYLRTSDMTMWHSTRTYTNNATDCVLEGCYAKLTN